MHERFRESDRAANYVSTGLLHDFPDASAEVIHVTKSRSRKATCEVRDIGPVLERMCKSFPMASVDYHPDHHYGFVAEIRCHGERGRKTSFRKHHHGRARVIVLLTRIGQDEIKIGEYCVPKEHEPGLLPSDPMHN